MSSEDERLRVRYALFGPDGLNATDKWRMRSAEQMDRRKTYLAEQERVQQDRAAVVTVSDECARLRGELEALRAAHEEFYTEWDATNGAILKIFDGMEREAAERDDVIRALKSEVADLRVKLAEARTEGLKSLHNSLVASARMAIDTCNEVTNYNARRVEVSQSEAAQREELAALQAKADALATELERLRTHKDFRFAREEGDSDAFELPSFLPPPRRDN